MNHPTSRRWGLGIALVAAMAVVAVALLYLGLGARGAGEPVPGTAPEAGRAAGTGPTSAPAHPGGARDGAMAGPVPSAGATVFARQAVSILFDWDTTTDTPASTTAELLAVADPTGEETPGLLADLPAYLPDDSGWQRLREYQTRQRLVVEAAEVPDAWTAAADAGELHDARPGTTAVTVRGVRHRSGVVAGRTQTTAQPVVLTVFVLCEPAASDCRLLRLGALGKVLD